MYSEKQKSKTKTFRGWFTRKKKREEAHDQLNEISDESEDEVDNLDDVFDQSSEIDPCTSTNELRIFVGTWNVAGRSPVGSLAVDLDEWLNLKDAADMYVLGFQEIVPLKTRNVIGAEDPTEATNWNLLIGKTLNDKYGSPWSTPMKNPISSYHYHYDKISDSERRTSFSGHSGIQLLSSQDENLYDGSKYKLMASKKMVGVFISIWMKKKLLRKYCVSNVKFSSVACGIMGYLGNKGSVSVSMSIEGTSFCFIAAHLASGEKKGDEGRRNHQVSEIFRRTSFPRSSEDDDNPHPLTILGHECDRILWYGKGVKQLSYFRSESKFSDHRPVSALFSIPVEVMKPTNPRVVPMQTILPTITPPRKREAGNSNEETKSTLLSLMGKDLIEASPTNMQKV
ncbi:hypothetical protein GH714_011869 [Hevea brasiliensis]|uniref:Inositol polyphosphate-related phosphatase domain-containing protein n=1 Tax=Hevea brasiliensis TaxID=3981 RepID=A0A6A6M812_HEVBR|nr:hypothetical protein GH714_011869 [Hevea brasiliensis]